MVKAILRFENTAFDAEGDFGVALVINKDDKKRNNGKSSICRVWKCSNCCLWAWTDHGTDSGKTGNGK